MGEFQGLSRKALALGNTPNYTGDLLAGITATDFPPHPREFRSSAVLTA